MNKDDLAHKVAIDKVAEIVTDPNYSSDINAIPETAAPVAKLLSVQTGLNTALDIQTTSTKEKTSHADAMWKNMAHTFMKAVHKGRPMARAAGREDLIILLETEISAILQTSKDEAISICRNLLKAFTDPANAAVFTNIKPADVTDMTNSLNAFDTVKNDTGLAIDFKKVKGTAQIRILIKEGFAAINDIYDLVYGEYIDSNKTLVDLIHDAMDIEIEGVRHTSITALCLDADAPEGASNLLQGVLMEMTDINRTAISDHYGIATIIKFKPGWQHLKFSKAGFVSNETSSILKRGKSLTIEVLMKRV